MKTQFVLKPLAAIIATVFVLSGCNSETASVGSSEVDSVQQVQDSQQPSQDDVMPASATVKLGVKFPEPEVGAAWIGDSKTIEVSFYRNDFVGSLDEAEDVSDALEECKNDDNDWEQNEGFGNDELNCYEMDGNELRQRLAKTATLTNEAPTASVDLVPGKYRVEAAFFNDQGELQETSVSYVTLGDGTHNIALRGMSATWTAQEPISLQLLNQSSDVDWDPEKEGVQTAAEVLGITSSIAGLHLPSLLSYPDGISYDSEYNLDTYSVDVLTGHNYDEDGQSALFVPVWRLNDGDSEIDLHPENKHEYGPTEQGFAHFEISSSLAGLFQEYNGTKNNTFIELGHRSVSFGNNYSEDGNYRGHYAEIMFGAAQADSDEGEEVWRHKYSERNYTYWDNDLQEQVETGLRIADINTETESEGYSQLFFEVLNGKLNQFEDGSTISGHLIEVLEKFTNSEITVTPAAMLDASLNEIAQQQGLVAEAASNCSTTEASEVWYSNQYMWDEEQSAWVAGTINPFVETGNNGWIFNNIEQERNNRQNEIDWREDELALRQTELDELLANGATEDDPDVTWRRQSIEQETLYINNERDALTKLDTVETEYMLMADLNADGSAHIFETGVYFENGPYVNCNFVNNSNWNNDTGMNEYAYGINCEGNTTPTQTIQASTFSAEVEMCVQPFTLTASQLDISYPTDGEVIIE